MLNVIPRIKYDQEKVLSCSSRVIDQSANDSIKTLMDVVEEYVTNSIDSYIRLQRKKYPLPQKLDWSSSKELKVFIFYSDSAKTLKILDYAEGITIEQLNNFQIIGTHTSAFYNRGGFGRGAKFPACKGEVTIQSICNDKYAQCKIYKKKEDGEYVLKLENDQSNLNIMRQELKVTKNATLVTFKKYDNRIIDNDFTFYKPENFIERLRKLIPLRKILDKDFPVSIYFNNLDDNKNHTKKQYTVIKYDTPSHKEICHMKRIILKNYKNADIFVNLNKSNVFLSTKWKAEETRFRDSVFLITNGFDIVYANSLLFPEHKDFFGEIIIPDYIQILLNDSNKSILDANRRVGLNSDNSFYKELIDQVKSELSNLISIELNKTKLTDFHSNTYAKELSDISKKLSELFNKESSLADNDHNFKNILKLNGIACQARFIKMIPDESKQISVVLLDEFKNTNCDYINVMVHITKIDSTGNIKDTVQRSHKSISFPKKVKLIKTNNDWKATFKIIGEEVYKNTSDSNEEVMIQFSYEDKIDRIKFQVGYKQSIIDFENKNIIFKNKNVSVESGKRRTIAIYGKKELDGHWINVIHSNENAIKLINSKCRLVYPSKHKLNDYDPALPVNHCVGKIEIVGEKIKEETVMSIKEDTDIKCNINVVQMEGGFLYKLVNLEDKEIESRWNNDNVLEINRKYKLLSFINGSKYDDYPGENSSVVRSMVSHIIAYRTAEKAIFQKYDENDDTQKYHPFEIVQELTNAYQKALNITFDRLVLSFLSPSDKGNMNFLANLQFRNKHEEFMKMYEQVRKQ
jgi:hypothetical protein